MRIEQLSPNCTIICGDNQAAVSAIGHTFDAIITDPPYGINFRFHDNKNKKSLISPNTKPIYGDDKPFDPSWLLSLMGNTRIRERNPTYQRTLALMGANHFAQHIPPGVGSWLCWDKACGQGSATSFVDAEFGWANRTIKRCVFHHLWLGCLRAGQDSSAITKRTHPSQKPVELMTWLLQQTRIGLGKTVLDPYMGSGSTGVACLQAGRKFIGIEIDEEYFEIAKIRLMKQINDHSYQPLFTECTTQDSVDENT